MAFGHILLTPWIYGIYFISIRSFGALSSEYMGCFLNENLNVSNSLQVPISSITHGLCSDVCLTNNYTYASFNKSLCYCTNNYMSKLMKEIDDYCDVSCPENIMNKQCHLYLKTYKIRNTSEESNYPQAIYLGCYGEKMGDDDNRLLKFPHERYPDNTPQKCSEECFKIGFLYSGTTNGEVVGAACWCGNQYPSKRFKINDSKCNVHCTGDSTKYCGGLWKLSVYSTGIVDYPIGNSVGCYDSNNFNQFGRKINKLKETVDSHRCYYICNERGYKYASVSEDYCECTNKEPSLDERRKQEECRKCNGDETEYCGGSETFSVYENDWFGNVSGDLSKKHFGCFKNYWMYPAMDGWNISFPDGLTSQKCVTSCYSRGFPFAALVSSDECLCSFVSPSIDGKVDGNNCNSTCSGGSEHVCAADRSHYNVFTTGLHTKTVAGHYFMGCFVDDPNKEHQKVMASVDLSSTNTPYICSKHCDGGGFRYFGLSYSRLCWCGNAPPEDRLRSSDNNLCAQQCTGDANKYCGGVLITAVYRIGMVAEMIYNCSTVCDCYFLPKDNVTTINCSKRKLIKAPENFEHIKNTSSKIDFIFKDNFIEVQPNFRSQHFELLDISNNNITTLDVNLFPKTLKVLFVQNNKLTSLDVLESLFQIVDVITIANNPWPCECNLKTLLEKNKFKIKDLNDVTCVPDSDPSAKSLIFVMKDDSCKNKKINYFYILIVSGFIVFICILSIYLNLHKKMWLYIRYNRCTPCSDVVYHQTDKNKDSSETFMQRIQYKELEVATENWNQSRILGEGGFGVVYKGNWRYTDVAIKRLKSDGLVEKVINMHTLGDDDINLSKEIMFLNAVKHDNILSMYGFCFHSTGSCLIYQYMANGSLEDRLLCKNGTKSLSWVMRNNIALGTARGLQFLHNMETPLIHGDIKSANILLDSNFEPRIGDFGLARTGPSEEISNNIGFDVSRVCGTRPYLPDDFCKSKKLSIKVDTYSFGVVMFEIATGLRAFNRYKNYKYLKEYVNKYDKSSLHDIADKSAGQDSFIVFDALISLGKACVADMAENRPEMAIVYMNLQNVLTALTKAVTDNGAQLKETKYLSQNVKADLTKLNEIKAALLAPLHEIPSISDLYSNSVGEVDPRKIITAAALGKSNSNEISVGFRYRKMIV